jgi:HlyD family secretion protein
MKRLVGFVILLIAAGGGWWYYVKYGQPAEKPQVLTAAISQGDVVEAVTATGSLDPVRRYDVGSQVSGVVKAIYVDYNSIVKKDQLLAEIDPSLLEVQVEVQQAVIDRQQTDIESQEVQLDEEKKQFERTKSLFERGLETEQDYEAAERDIKTSEASIVSAQKALVSARANLEAAKLNVSYTRIVAPADGVIVERKVDVGQTVQSSMQVASFFVLSTPLESLKLTAEVDESAIGEVRPGMDVRFTVDAYGQQQFRGTVDAVRLNATTTNNVVTYPVWITVPNPDLKLRPSMTASLRIIVSTSPNVVRVPNAALRFRPNAEIYTALGLTPPQAAPATPPGAARAAGSGAPVTALPHVNPNADKIDQLWAPLLTSETMGTVWTWNEARKDLKQIRVRLGVTDGTFTQITSGDLHVGDPVVTSVILPASSRPKSTVNPLLSQPRGGMGGPGGNYGGPGGGGGYGGPAGGGGRGGN